MSQKVSRKTAVGTEEKEKRNSPVKEMKKKMAANAEKEKQATDKPTDNKPTEKAEKPASTEKAAEKVAEKVAEKATEKTDKQDKNEKADKSGDKKAEKQSEKKEPQADKSKADSSSKKDDSSKPEPTKADTKKPESKPKQNGRAAHNGVSDVTLSTNGTDDVVNGTVSADSEDDDVMLVIDDQDELFPELTYDDTSDVECFEPPTPDSAPSRSLTRRSQVKSTRTPETPRPLSGKQELDDPKEKVLKLKEDVPTTDRKLRSADSPKPESKKESTKKDSPKKSQENEQAKEGQTTQDKSQEEKKDEKESEKVEMEVTIELEGADEEPRKTDTNYSKSRVKVSPYRRSMRIADQTNTSLQANYTGNNTTMEMDITESSSFLEETNLDDSSYLRGLRSIRGRTSYKPLKEITLRHVTANRPARPAPAQINASLDAHNRPTAPVVGRKRKPDSDDTVELGVEAAELSHVATKRMRVLDRLTEPFRRVAAAAALPTVARRNAEIVGINTDLPRTAPVANTETFDPETLKQPPTSEQPIAVPLRPEERDSKRCVIM